MKRVFVLVEGQTEEVFVRDTLTSHLAPFDVYPTAVILKTKRIAAGGAFRGGVTSAAQILGDIRRLLVDTAASVTTMLDYYGLPDDFPGMSTRPSELPRARVAHVEAALVEAIGHKSFHPHVVLHEYEAWIFSAPHAAASVFDDPSVPSQLAAIATTAGGAELIDDGPLTAPSKRLANVFAKYKKTLHGPTAVGAIGIARVREACPHAAAWFAWLERLA